MPETRWAFIHPFQLRLQRGIEVYLWNLAAELASQGVQVEILTWDGPLAVPAFAQVPGLRLRRVPRVRYFQAQFGVIFYLYWLLTGKYQHVFVHFAGYGEGPALWLARKLRRLPFSVVFHFPPSLVPHRYREFRRWGFDRRARHRIGVSRATAEEVKQWAGRDCSVIGHGVDIQRFRPEATLRNQIREKLGVSHDALVLISAAALEERKGVQWVIRAIPGLLAVLPNLVYWVLGDGPFKPQLEKLVHQLNLQNKVMFLGHQSDIEPFLAGSDLSLLLSYGEASPVSILEFAAAELPIITSLHPPFDELIHPDYGIQVDEEDAGQVGAAILRLAAEPETRKRMGAAGQEWVSANHSWTEVAKQYNQLIEGEG